MSPRLLAIVEREYLERIRTKAFVIGTILGPVIMGGMIVAPRMVARSSGRPLRVAVLDRTTTTLGAAVEEALRSRRFDVERDGGLVPPAAREAVLKKAVRERTLDGYLLIPEDALAANTAIYFGRNVSNRGDLRTMERAVSEVVVGARLTNAGLDPDEVKGLTRELDLRTIRVSASGEREDRGASAMFAVVLLMILYVSILMWGQAVMASVIEEKSSRVVEVMGSGVGPQALLAGKLLGVGGAGLTQFLVWSASIFGVSLVTSGPLASSLEIPDVNPLTLISFVLFFLLGFFLYSGLYAAIGAAVNTVQEAQNLVFPMVLPIVLSVVFFPAVLEAPDGRLALALSMFPGTSPLIMFLRIVVLTPPLWQIALSVALAALGILAVLRVSARIYRVGILMYGKRPTFPELWRWARHE